MTQNCKNTIWALNKTANQNGPPMSQYKLNQQVWLDASHLKLPHQKAKLTPKRLGPFTITKEISPVAYQLALPANWRIHNVFHASLLNPYRKTTAHGPNFTRPPPDLIEGEEEFEVERIITHWEFGRSKCLQYLIKWKGYPESDNTWEPADQVHAPQLVKQYHSAATHQSSIKTGCVRPYQSTGKDQSAAKVQRLKEVQPTLHNCIECPTISPASLLNASLRTSLSKNSLLSNTPSTTLTPPNLAPLVSSASVISLIPNMSLTTVGIASSTTVPSTTPIEACLMLQSMLPPNPLTTAHPLPESLVMLATSPFQSRNY